MAGCTNKQIITQTQGRICKNTSTIIRSRANQKPVVKTENDIINAYLDLFKNYLLLIDKINAIKELNKGEVFE